MPRAVGMHRLAPMHLMADANTGNSDLAFREVMREIQKLSIAIITHADHLTP